MILVNNPGSWSHVYGSLAHATWHGWTPTDLVFPFFLFIVGVALPFSFEKRLVRSDDRTDLLAHVLRRSAVLFALGLFMAGFPRFELSTIRIMGVLQRIAVVYLAAACAYLFLRARWRWWLAGGLLATYWALLEWVPVPGFGAGDLSLEGNLPAFVDRVLLGGHLWQDTWDPEGLLSTLPAVSTTLLGTFAGSGFGRLDRATRRRSGCSWPEPRPSCSVWLGIRSSDQQESVDQLIRPVHRRCGPAGTGPVLLDDRRPGMVEIGRAVGRIRDER